MFGPDKFPGVLLSSSLVRRREAFRETAQRLLNVADAVPFVKLYLLGVLGRVLPPIVNRRTLPA